MGREKLLSIVKNLNNELIEVYRKLHQSPELPNQEFETTNSLIRLLEDVDIDIIDLNLKTGLVAEINGGAKGPVIAIRCDIDALPIEEETDLPYKSLIKGKMHACGHDFHMAVILGAVYLLKKNEQNLKGKVKVIFQPAEESADGAKEILQTGVLDDVDVIFGIHNTPDLDSGVIGVKTGAMTAAVDRFEIEILGVGSHAAKPEKSIDPIIIASNIVMSLQTIVSRNISPTSNALLSVTHIESGNTWNVIPESAYIEGTVRTLDESDRNLIFKRMNEIINGTAQLFGGSAKLIWHSSSPSTNNTENWVKVSSEIAKNLNLDVREVSMGLEGEDFAYYQQKIPGAFIITGIGKSYAHHHPKFQIDENVILDYAKYFASLAEKSLIEISSK